MTQRRRLVHQKLGTTQLHQPYQHHQVSLTHAAVDLYRIIQRTLSLQTAMILLFTGNLFDHSFCSWRSLLSVADIKFMALNTCDGVWDRRSYDKTRLQPKNRSWFWSYRSGVMLWNPVTLVVIMVSKDTATFQVLLIVYVFCAWNIIAVEINSGVHLLKS